MELWNGDFVEGSCYRILGFMSGEMGCGLLSGFGFGLAVGVVGCTSRHDLHKLCHH